MALKITPPESGTLEIKRCYIPGLKVETNCPSCGTVLVRDYAHDRYFSYPVINAPSDLWFNCPECDCEWSIRVELRLTLEEAVAGG